MRVAATQYDAIAEQYEAYSEANAFNALCERPTTLSLLGPLAQASVLDAACGPGFYGAWALARGAKVVAFDASVRMVALAQKRLAQSLVRVASLEEKLGWCKDESFDVVICALALDHVSDLAIPMREFHRLLRPSGYLVFSIEHPSIVSERKGSAISDDIAEHRSEILGTLLSYKHPLEAYFHALKAAGFGALLVKEAWPTEECRIQYPDIYETLRSRPQFLAVRGEKRSDA